MSKTFDIVAKLRNLCNILKDDGVHYSDYVTELTYLLFLEMLAEQNSEEPIPGEYRWATLEAEESKCGAATRLVRHRQNGDA